MNFRMQIRFKGFEFIGHLILMIACLLKMSLFSVPGHIFSGIQYKMHPFQITIKNYFCITLIIIKLINYITLINFNILDNLHENYFHEKFDSN